MGSKRAAAGKHGNEEEDQCIWQMHLVIGNQWAKIRQHCPNRTENQIKSRHKTLQLILMPAWCGALHLAMMAAALARMATALMLRLISHLASTISPTIWAPQLRLSGCFTFFRSNSSFLSVLPPPMRRTLPSTSPFLCL